MCLDPTFMRMRVPLTKLQDVPDMTGRIPRKDLAKAPSQVCFMTISQSNSSNMTRDRIHRELHFDIDISNAKACVFCISYMREGESSLEVSL